MVQSVGVLFLTKHTTRLRKYVNLGDLLSEAIDPHFSPLLLVKVRTKNAGLKLKMLLNEDMR